MELEKIKKIVDNLNGVSTIALTGYGEPLIHPRFLDAVKYCKEKGLEVQTTSNGLLLNSDKKIIELIASGLDSISFSIESVDDVNAIAHPNLNTLENVRRLINIKKEMNSITPSITLQTLMLKRKESDLFDVIKWGALNGVDRINVARFELNTLKDVERPSVDDEKKIFEEFERLRRKYNIRIDCIQDMVYTGVKGFLYKHFKHLLRMDKNCIRLHDFIYINVEGEVNPCCALIDYRMGNICEEDLDQIWKSDRYNRFRKNYHKAPWCSGCDFAKLKQVELN
jgi:MoaA/NifB/PqqE/SkfB family radical SAM enzyme